MEKDKEKREISPEIKEHYEVIKVLPGEVKFGGATYDLRKISLEQANKLHEQKFPYLKKKKGAAPASSKP